MPHKNLVATTMWQGVLYTDDNDVYAKMMQIYIPTMMQMLTLTK